MTLLKNLTGPELVNQLLTAVYRTQSYTIVFTKARQLFLSSARQIQSKASLPISKFHFDIILRFTGTYSNWTPKGFTTKQHMHLSYACHMPRPPLLPNKILTSSTNHNACSHYVFLQTSATPPRFRANTVKRLQAATKTLVTEMRSIRFIHLYRNGN